MTKMKIGPWEVEVDVESTRRAHAENYSSTERERLTYPIIQLPLQFTDEKSGFFKNKLMWFGFSVAAVISIVNLLNSIYPPVPYIPVKRQSISHFFTEKPWNAMGGVRLSFYPFAIGISFLIPLDLLFSCWAFYSAGNVLRCGRDILAIA